jgi:hypothetical protein
MIQALDQAFVYSLQALASFPTVLWLRRAVLGLVELALRILSVWP